jgi:subtilisin family serine protease
MPKSIRVLISFSICVGVLIFASVFFAFRSGAQLPSPQESTTSQQSTAPAKQRMPFVPGEILVRYRSDAQPGSNALSTHIAADDGTVVPVRVERFKGSELIDGLRLVRVAPADTLKAVAAMRRLPQVLYAEPNYILRAAVNPNDTHASLQYGLTKIGAQQAWDTKTGSTGSDRVVVAVIDQGIDPTHEDLQPNIWINQAETPGNGVDDDANGFIDDVNGFNFVNSNENIFSGQDGESHGSHVAGIIGAVGNNNRGVAGVNWSVGLMSLKFLDADGFGDTADAIIACQYAHTMRTLWESTSHARGANIKVVNASFGGAFFNQSFLEAIQALNSAGVLFVTAAGNVENGTRERNNDLVPHFPSSFDVPNIVAVASTDALDSLSEFSHFGATSVDLAAPGEAILSTTPPCVNPNPQTCFPSFPEGFSDTDDTYSVFDGTSMSAPYVSGAAALLWAQNPGLTVQRVKNLLLLNGDIIPAMADKSYSGRRLNVGKSFQALAESDTSAPGPVGSFHISSQNGRNLTLGWTASGDDGAAGRAALYEVTFTDQSGEVFPLKGVLPRNSGFLQKVDVSIPLRHTTGTLNIRGLDNAGNASTTVNLPVGVPPSAGDPYTNARSAGPVALSTGGTWLEIDADDRYVSFPLPFSFPFFGSNHDTLLISTNGALYFSNPPRRCPAANPQCTDADADDPPGSPRALGGYKMIAGLWEDLDLRKSERPDAGVYVVTPAGGTRVIFRWQGVPCSFNGSVCLGGDDINFEIELNSNGTIKTRYGNGNTDLLPTVGIGGGEQEGYVVDTHTSEESPINLTLKEEVTFTPRAQSVSTLQLAQANVNVGEANGFVAITVNRTGDSSSFASVNYTTSDTAGLANCTTLNTSKASERCDYETTVGTLRFSRGETSKTFNVPIVNDVLVEGNENFTVTLSGVTGASLGTSTATVTIAENDTGQSQNPIDSIPFFVTQQYIDFLGRLPDATGFANWVATLNGCPNGGFGEFDNPHCDRVHVSSGFFLSVEFQGRGYFAYRFYEVALDRRPTYGEFVPDMAQVGGPQSPESEVLSKAAYTEAWTQRTAFKSRYDALSNSAYVNALETNAEVTLPNKAALVTALDDGEKTRGEVLREIVELNSVSNRFFNRAFVAMQYFGYLRRDPDTVGFQNWLNTMNADPSNFRHMIFGFLFSTEYRQRFGP